MSDLPPIKARIAIMALSSLVTAGLCEGVIRIADGNATPMIRLFADDSDGHIRLQPDGLARVARAADEPWELRTDSSGHRIPSQAVSPTSWIAVGDSQVMGNGVDDDAPFPALLTLDGEGVHNLGVPGYGIGDALWSATEHLDRHPARGVIIIVNQMNDWDEVDAPVGSRYRVRGGWLVDQEDADTIRGRFLASPFSRSHLIFLLGHLALKDWSAPPPPAPDWMTDPAQMRHTTLLFANAIRDFSSAHPGTRVVPVYLPADLYAAPGRADASPLAPHVGDLSVPPWEDKRLRDQVLTALADFNPVDLSTVLTGPEHFLVGDYHLSEAGHAAAANAITDAVLQAPGPEKSPEQAAETHIPD